uniref:Uncharacterized protein n=1 Tax=Arundo donax TaxID=35708 RepID=A0A0A9FMG8_ARUDO
MAESVPIELKISLPSLTFPV